MAATDTRQNLDSDTEVTPAAPKKAPAKKAAGRKPAAARKPAAKKAAAPKGTGPADATGEGDEEPTDIAELDAPDAEIAADTDVVEVVAVGDDAEDDATTEPTPEDKASGDFV
ncbi:MAG: RNA polymerase sigma factor, partial [Rhodococcus fascians]